MGKAKKATLQEAWEEQEAAATIEAFIKADAWAQSVKGTPYGSTTPTLSKETNR